MSDIGITITDNLLAQADDLMMMILRGRTLSRAAFCVGRKKKRVIIGTTGFDDEQKSHR